MTTISPITTPADVRARSLDELDATDAKLQTFIDDVEIQFADAIPAFVTHAEDNEDYKKRTVRVVSQIILEFMAGGGSLSQESQSYTGIGSRSVSYKSTARENLTLTSADIQLLALKPRESSGIGLLRLGYSRPTRYDGQIWRDITAWDDWVF